MIIDMDSSTVKEKIKEYILSASSNREKIHDNSLIFKEGFFDSMGFVMLISFIDEAFGIKTVDADLVEENFESINAITDFVVRKLK